MLLVDINQVEGFKNVFYSLVWLISLSVDFSEECENLPDVVKHCTRISCELRADDDGNEKEYCNRS